MPMKTHARTPRAILLLTLLLSCLTTVVHAETGPYQRTMERYVLPEVTLVDQNGNRVRLTSLLQPDRPLIVDFIFGTCTTICPILSASYLNLQQKLGADVQKVHLISISIDPEHDTPRVMKEYLTRYRAKPGWDFLTGSRKDIDAVMKAFNAYIPDKMSHYALTFIRRPENGEWIRISGIMSTSEFLAETRSVGIAGI